MLTQSELFCWSISPKEQTIFLNQPEAFFTVIGGIEDQKTQIDIYAVDRWIDCDGKETWQKNEADFVIYPSQVVLGKGEQQLVSVKWKNRENIRLEKAFRIVFKGKSLSNEKDLPPIAASFYVASHRYSEPNISVKDFKIEACGGEKLLSLELVNHGKRHKSLKQEHMELLVTFRNHVGQMQTMALTESDFGNKLEACIDVLAEMSRYIRIPWLEGYPQEIQSVEVLK
ncbi:MAG: hypothetical protein FJZ56_06780 [Chlamydiae bacterium]|nr:hypothetical protein [Chlamydiota bacterium]